MHHSRVSQPSLIPIFIKLSSREPLSYSKFIKIHILKGESSIEVAGSNIYSTYFTCIHVISETKFTLTLSI